MCSCDVFRNSSVIDNILQIMKNSRTLIPVSENDLSHDYSCANDSYFIILYYSELKTLFLGGIG